MGYDPQRALRLMELFESEGLRADEAGAIVLQRMVRGEALSEIGGLD